MNKLKNNYFFVVIGAILTVTAQIFVVPLSYFYISNAFFSKFGMVAFNTPVFILFFLLFLLLGKIRSASMIGFWVIIGIWLLANTLTSECHAEELSIFIKDCLFVDILIIGFSWLGFKIARGANRPLKKGSLPDD